MITFLPIILKNLKTFLIGIAIIIFFVFAFYLVNKTIKVKRENEEYKRIEEETKVFHEDNIVKLKETLKKRNNAKKIDYNDGGNLDDDFLLKSLE
jgi:hypothetical protein